MSKKFEDTAVSVGKDMQLSIKENRGTFTSYKPKEGHEEVSSSTRTHFHWRLHGLASKLGAEVVGSGNADMKEQEVYDVEFKSHGWNIEFDSRFKSREDAIQNALEFAKRNGITVDGYAAKTD